MNFADPLLTSATQCVDQAELETFDGVSPGKYTIGLGQTKMSFCDDREGTWVKVAGPGLQEVQRVLIEGFA